MNYHFLFAILYGCFFVIRVVYHRRAGGFQNKVEFHESKMNMAFRAILGVGYISLVSLYVFYPPVLRWAGLSLPDWVRWIGVGLTVVSVALLWWVQWALDVQFDTTLHIRTGHKLISRGPYRWVRHPMYTSLFSMGVGWLLLTANWFIGGLLMGGIIFIMITRVNAEEALLINTFGESYITYIARTGRFLPRLFHHRGD
jgi:protein-S-isoprenylcysteine O-methyltransferase Ste14